MLQVPRTSVYPQGPSTPTTRSSSPRRLPRLPAQLPEAPPTSPPPRPRLAASPLARRAVTRARTSPEGAGLRRRQWPGVGSDNPGTWSEAGLGGPDYPAAVWGCGRVPAPTPSVPASGLGPLAKQGLWRRGPAEGRGGAAGMRVRGSVTYSESRTHAASLRRLTSAHDLGDDLRGPPFPACPALQYGAEDPAGLETLAAARLDPAPRPGLLRGRVSGATCARPRLRAPPLAAPVSPLARVTRSFVLVHRPDNGYRAEVPERKFTFLQLKLMLFDHFLRARHFSTCVSSVNSASSSY